MKWIKKNSLVWSFALILVISIFTSANVRWGDQRWHAIISHDANGYYAYLPAMFIYQDFNFRFYDDEIKEDRLKNTHLNYDFREKSNNQYVNKYYVGTSILQIPFFLVAHILSEPLGFSNNGYSKIYYIGINLAAIFYLLLGLLYLKKILSIYGFDSFLVHMVLFILYFGTHLFYYTIFEPGMSHVYSFALISMLIYYGMNYFSVPQFKSAIIFTILLGLITLIRPVNILAVLLIPFIANSKSHLIRGMRYLFSGFAYRFILLVFIFIIITFIQLLVYKIQTGLYIVYSYADEGFNFLSPHMIDILFSYKKGLFLYTPICFIALFGFYKLYSNNRFTAISLILFFTVLTYVLSSWWSWWYGGSFSSRVFVDYLSIFGILLAFFLLQLKEIRYKKMAFAFLFLLVLFNQKQTYLYRTGEIHFVNMDQEKFWDSVFKLH